MKTRRPVHRTILEYNLALPCDSSFGEVQVQQKNEYDVNKFFIDVDDTTVSPMITTEPTFRRAAEEAKKSPCISPAGSSSPKFIHVNNTNLFVLMDGVSMFIEGHSTFYVDEDTQVVQKYITEKARKQKEALLDTVDEAIKDIEQDNRDSSMISKVPSSLVAQPPKNNDSALRKHKFYEIFKNARPNPHGPTIFGKQTRPSPRQARSAAECTSPVKKTPTSPSNGLASNSSYASLTHSKSGYDSGYHSQNRKHTKYKKPVSLEDIGRSNRTLDLDDVELLNLIGVGTQGKVYRVLVDSKLYAMKRIDVKEATEAANSIERQGRKRGLIKELNMIRLQRSNSSTHLMQMFNGVASVDNERQHLSILMELMSFSVEDVQNMCARLPPNELAKLTQTSFRNFATGNNSTKLRQEVDNLFKQQNGSCMHVMGRNKFNKPAEWEYEYDRQTALPDIVLSLLAADVLLGLQELHTVYGIVHCDVKPANVLVNFEMVKFKLTDFGCGCVMNEEDKRVRRSGVDLGSKLYKAPERLSNEYSNDAQPADNELLEMEEGDEFVGSKEVVEFTAKADVWSLGIMLLELASGEHPCKPFKSDFWNYSNLLKLSKMLKPLNFSPFLCDFVVRCLSVDETKRWTVDKLLQHPFIKKYEDVPRTKLRSFLQKLEKESATYQRKQHREALEQQILISTTRQASDNYKNQSLKKWKAFTGFLAVAPELSDTKKYPQISAHMKPTKKIN